MVKFVCNVCANEITGNYFELKHTLGYGSVNDLKLLHLHVCYECVDDFISNMIKDFKINPWKGWDEI